MGIIIGLVGHARVGKDTFAEYLTKCLKERHQRNFEHVAFAKQLKMMCKEHFELSDDQLWESGKNIRETPDKRFVKEESIWVSEYEGDTDLVEYWTPREIMQELGGFYRRIDRDFWVKALNLHLIGNDIKDAIITDVRHINECEFVKINKGVLIKIVREDADEIHGMRHESETALDGRPGDYFDIEINNCGTLEDLYIAAEDSSNAIMMIENMINRGRIVKDGKE